LVAENLASVVGLAPVGICLYLLHGSNRPGLGPFVTKLSNESNYFCPFSTNHIK